MVTSRISNPPKHSANVPLSKCNAFAERCQEVIVFAPGDRYQGGNLVEGWLKRAGIPSIKEVWRKAKKEHRLWIYPTRKLTP